MSTGKRLAKRSIIGTRVCAPGQDGKYYTGVIHAVKTPSSTSTNRAGDTTTSTTSSSTSTTTTTTSTTTTTTSSASTGLSITPRTRYSVRFDAVTGDGRPPSPSAEYSDRDLIGPGFGSVTTARLVPGQKVYLTYNGREIHAEVTQHREHLDEVDVVIAPNGQEGTMRLTKRIDEVRLLESRKSARLADMDTDFARLADMAGDRKRTSSHSIEVPQVIGSRKRRPSSSNDSERSYNGWSDRPHGCGREGCRVNERGDCMDECTAALVLMSLSCSPHSPHNPLPIHCQHNYGSWGDQSAMGNVVAGSPGVGGTSNSSSSSTGSSGSSGASWRSGTPSPPLSEEGTPTNGGIWPSSTTGSNGTQHNQPTYPYRNASGSSSGSTPGSTTLDEGIVPDYLDEHRPRKKKIRSRGSREPVEPASDACVTFESEQANAAVVFKCTWKGCLEIKATVPLIEEHVRQCHLGPKKKQSPNDEDVDMSSQEEEFYYEEVAVDHMSSPPTMSHRDMARPPHEDPEYQKQLRLEAVVPVATSCPEPTIVAVRGRHSPYPIPQATVRVKHLKLSPRSYHAYQQHHMGLLALASGKMTSPRRLRGETKKCRKVYGMEHRDLWCTQCKWKKACTRFGD